ncbi:MAG: IclR family transcriptional regulator, partial [Ornithinimicrobium sp.]|uniref:IclR family transcriptional regulator n=1 Tax=Ornithinimicrobium sp. TaxID=1977084 RepID=UPI003D9BC587
AAAALLALGSRESTEGPGLGVVRLAEITGGDKGQVSRLLATLTERGLVERDPQTRLYRLGWQLFALAARAGDQRLLALAAPVLTSLAERVGERASLTVLHGAEVLTVSSLAPPRAVQAIGWVGRTVPAYCTSSGRALLFDHSKADLEALFVDEPFAPRGSGSPTDVASLHRRVAASRARGYAAVAGEFEPELAAAAAPVRDLHGSVCAAVNVSAPRFRYTAQGRLAGLGRQVTDAADELSALLGRDG